MMPTLIEATSHGAVTVLRLNRPDKKNALTVEMYRLLADGLRAAEADEATRVVVIAGQPGAFSSGNDIADFLAAGNVDENAPVIQFLHGIAAFEKPLIAAVGGIAIGIGTTMLLHCDAVVAGRGTRFALPFAHLGLVPEAASSLLFPAIAGPIRASWYLLSGEPFDGVRAAELGVVSHLVDDDAIESTARTIASHLAALPPDAVRETKRLIRASRRSPVRDAMDREQTAFAERLLSSEARAAFAAFTQGKRTPV